LLSSRSNLRLDSFVFTRESFALAREHLAPHGVMVVSHAVGTPWFIDRMRATLRNAFGKFPLLLTEELGVAYAVAAPTAPAPPPAAGGSGRGGRRAVSFP